jgi:tRNA A-37 threonylcarbamoyl transferase component Bud32
VTVQKLLGRGGMADVYLGMHTTLNRPVAVKILHGHLLEDDSLMERFRSEAQAVANLRHPNIVQVYDFDIADDQPYIIMELLEGPSLADYLGILRQTDQVIPPKTIARLVSGIAKALDYAHSRGIVHRDVKPSNVLLRREVGPFDPEAPLPDDAEPILTDFGVARITNTAIRTASGAIVGTPAYMSPEQISGTQIDSRSDVYSLGVMVYELVSGRLPFVAESETIAATLVKHITEQPPPLPEAPPAAQGVVFRALAKDRSERHQTAGALAFDLKKALGLPITPEDQAARADTATLKLPQSAIGALTQTGARAHPARRLPLTIGLVALVIVVGAAAIAVGTGLFESESNTPALPTGNEVTEPAVFGEVQYGDAAAEVDQIVVNVDNLAPPPEGMQYEFWLLGPETRRSIGILDVNAEGKGELAYTDAQGENLIASFSRFEVTIEPMPDTNPLPTGNVAYSGAVPDQPLGHIRHLLSGFGRTPDGIGLVTGLMRDTALIQTVSQDLADAQNAADLDETKRQAEALVNLIEGVGGDHYGDLDGDGDITNPSDGFGLLPSAESGGYIQTSIEHARFAAGTPQATASIIEQAGLMEIAAQNLGGWAAQLRDAALAVIDSDDSRAADEYVQKIVELVDLFVNGQDTNGNGIVEPIPNEGGAKTVKQYALNMAAMAVLPGAERIPEPANTPGPTEPASFLDEDIY